ncbi:MAG: hypothetical protein RL064_899 [Bacteroidota bacterium]|jgi:mRNA interferase HicA
MKSSELHRKIKKNGWEHFKTEGSHYIYKKEGKKYPVPYHGSKEVGLGLLKKMMKEMDLKF